MIALLPIRPKYVDEILSGNKKVEFRRTKFKRDVRYIVIYACYPVKKIVGYFDVEMIDDTTPQMAWDNYGSVGSIDQDSFNDYYKGSERAYVIGIDEVVCFDNHLSLSDICTELQAPQSYRYLSTALFEKAKMEGSRI
ncbi:MAG TPA: ASCH domain-containing protein [Porticoccus sp.]|nr:ASCH domain-containing protein [Porticoccus sp.]